MSKRRAYRELPDVELPSELDEEIRAMIQVAEDDIVERRARGELRPTNVGRASRGRAMDQAVVEPAAKISGLEARLADCVVQLRSLLDLAGSRPTLACESLPAAALDGPIGIRRGQLLVFPPAPNPKHGVELRIVGVPVPAEEGVERFRVQVELFRLGPRARRVPRGQWTPSAFLRDETLAGHFFDERGIWILERPLAAAELPELVLAYRLMSQP